jgi:hypothetical protein
MNKALALVSGATLTTYLFNMSTQNITQPFAYGMIWGISFSISAMIAISYLYKSFLIIKNEGEMTDETYLHKSFFKEEKDEEEMTEKDEGEMAEENGKEVRYNCCVCKNVKCECICDLLMTSDKCKCEFCPLDKNELVMTVEYK